jgi:hypothetical protein
VKLAAEATEAALKGTAKGAKKLKVGKAIPFIGTVVTIIGWEGDVWAKGFVSGSANSVVDAIPILNTAKITAEIIGGADLIPDTGDIPIE